MPYTRGQVLHRFLLGALVGSLCVGGCEANPAFNPDATDATVDSSTGGGYDGIGVTGADPDQPLGDVCQPLPPPQGNVMTVRPEDAESLNGIIATAPAGTTFLFEPGTYAMSGGLWITNPGVTLRSSTGNPEDVILDGQRIAGTLIAPVAPNITIAEMTLQRPAEHAIHTSGGGGVPVTGVVAYRLRLIDPGFSAFKINPSSEDVPSDDGVLACSTIELTDAGRSELGGACENATGVAGFGAVGWTIRDNEISGFWCPTGYGGPAVFFAETSADNRVERNVLRDNAVGIQFGVYEDAEPFRPLDDLPCTDGYYGHYGGVIRDNMISATGTGIAASETGFDTGVALWQVCNVAVVHNTIVSAIGAHSSIEYRFDRTTAKILNNLVTDDILVRDDAGAPVAGNISGADLNNFTDPLGGNLHLVSSSSAIDAGVNLGEDASPHDIDGDVRAEAPDVGADEVQ
jgi:hypothetical protein